MLASNHIIKYDMRKCSSHTCQGVLLEPMSVNSHFLTYRIVDLWKGVSVAIRTIDQLSLFSKTVNQFYISKFNLSKDNFL